MSGFALYMSPWPQWRSHWHVWHAWPPGAQWLLLSSVSVCFTVLGSLWWSADAWQTWWQADDELQRLDEEASRLLQQAQVLRQRIQDLTATPHPSGLPIPAWQAWPQLPPPDDAHVLQQWLAWGRQQGLAVQAMPLTTANAVQYSGSLPALLAAVFGLPLAFPELRLTGFEWQHRAQDKHMTANPQTDSQLQLQLSWGRAQQVPLAAQVGKQAPAEHKTAPGLNPHLPGVQATQPATQPASQPVAHARALYNPFAVSALRSGLPKHIIEQVPKGWPQLHSPDLSQLQWVGTLYRTGERQTLLAFNGLVYTVHVGDRLGRDWGEVAEIAADHLVLREWHADAQGEWRPVNKRLPGGDSP